MSFVGKHISSLPTPAFIIDKETIENNCRSPTDLLTTQLIP